jgi:hypothetical protein
VKQKEHFLEQKVKENVQNLDLKLLLLLNKNRDHLNTNSASWTGSFKRRQQSSSLVSQRHLEMKKLIISHEPAIRQNIIIFDFECINLPIKSELR